MGRFYLVNVVISSKDTEVRTLTPYDDIDTATRKFHESFGSIGGGSKKIATILLDEFMNEIKKEVWLEPQPEPEPEPEPEPTPEPEEPENPDDGEEEEPTE
jgi:hypothetical protein